MSTGTSELGIRSRAKQHHERSDIERLRCISFSKFFTELAELMINFAVCEEDVPQKQSETE